jgi:hypothetical protein
LPQGSFFSGVAGDSTGLEFIDLEFRSGRRCRHPVKKIDSAGKFLYLEFQDVADVEAARR